jgi:clan AA aspartic protease
VNGVVDDKLRAMVSLPISVTRDAERTHVQVWIDTAFNGGLVIPRSLVESLGLEQQAATEAILADGNLVELETYACFFDWFGETYLTQVAANDGQYPLLGTMLLAGRKLQIDYAAMTVVLD